MDDDIIHEPYVIQEPIVIPLVYDDTSVVTSVQRVLFVHSAASSLSTYANETTFAIVYDFSSTLEEVLELLRRKFPARNIPRIGFAFHNHGDLTSFLNRETWLEESRNAQFIVDIIREFNLTNVDFLACKTLQSEKWRSFFQLLRDQTNVIVGASENDTGNMKYGGDWIMESTMEDIRNIYFTPEVENWASLLVVNSTIVANLTNPTLAMCISGNFMYVGVNGSIKKIDLTTNTVTQIYDQTASRPGVNMTSLTIVGNYLYFPYGSTTAGRVDLTTNSVTALWSSGFGAGFKNGFLSDGTYLYAGSTDSIYRVRISDVTAYIPFPGPYHVTLFISQPTITGKPIISGSYLYVSVEGSKINQYNLTTGTLLNSYLTTSGLSYMSNILEFNSSFYIGQYTTNTVVQRGIIKLGLDWTIQDSSYFTNSNIYDMVVYNNTLYCTTNESGTVISIPLLPTPYISSRPTVSAAITYPATIGSVSLSGGSALTSLDGTEVPGTFIIRSSIASTVYNAGTYTNVPATFNPTDTVTYGSASTSIPTITVLKGTPFLSASPTSATLMYPSKLSSLVITGGSCLVAAGGAVIPGTFSVHPDLSNSVFTEGTYQDISAIFIPTSTTNYNTVLTTIPVVTITRATTGQLLSLGIPAADLKNVGYTATDLKNANFTTAQLKAASFTPSEMKAAGFSTAALYSVFTTPAETKSVTKAVVADLLVSSSKTIVPLSTMVGYTFEPFVTSVAAVKVSEVSTPIIVSRSDMEFGKTAVYAVLDVSGSYMELPTYSSSIRVMNVGAERYRVYAANGTTIIQDNLLTGAIVAVDGLTVVIGSVTATMTPPPKVNFVLSAMNSSIQLSTSSVIPNYSPSFTADATITLNTSVPASVLQNTFYFRTDSNITTDASFVYYYVDTTKWPNKNTTLSARNGIVTSNAYVAGDTGAKDFLRDLAKQLFGTYLGADLFTNEDAVVSDINSKFDTVANNIIALLLSIDKTNGVFPGITADVSGNKYLKDNTSINNISRELLNELITAAPDRFVDIKTNYKYNTTEDGFYKMPILTGDTIAFKVTINPASDQNTRIPTTIQQMASRSYQVILNVS
jgi:hypothetical protein